MKKLYTLIIAIVGLNLAAQADSYTINISGFTYSPATLNVVVGDVVTIQASGNHPLLQVSQATWDAAGTTALPGGFGPETSNYTFTVTSTDDIYYVCTNHVSMGMKGKIIVSTATGISDLPSANALNVYPNPVTDGSLTVKGQSEMDGQHLELYSTSGQLVKSVDLNGLEMRVNLDVAAGMYTAIIVKDDKAVLRKRLVFVNGK